MSSIYHEHQTKMLCAVHALNNLMQRKSFTKADLDSICIELDPDSQNDNQHRSSLGLGNYDVNVLTIALHRVGYELTWFDKRRSVDELNTDQIFGYLINKPEAVGTAIKLGPMTPSRHWMALRELPRCGDGNGTQFVNLDSKQSSASVISENRVDFFKFLKDELLDDVELMLVLSPDVGSSGVWRS